MRAAQALLTAVAASAGVIIGYRFGRFHERYYGQHAPFRHIVEGDQGWS